MNKISPSILITPLDWGLGHTTRCIPIIQEFIALGCKVVVACNTTQKHVIVSECPGVITAPLPGYNLRYSRTGAGTILKIFFQLPKILIKIKQEHRWLKQFLSNNAVDIILSDNRFGLYSTRICSIYITHQLQIRTGLGKWCDAIARRINYSYIKKFSSCWVPDYQGHDNLAGALSHPHKKPPIPVHYIGGLSRLKKTSTISAEKIDMLFILSGPEPQRSVLENIVVRESKMSLLAITIVRGMPGSADELKVGSNVKVINYAGSNELGSIMCAASFICCRAGYSSIMDIAKLQKRSVLIPTPGQAEQEYLAKYLSANKMAVVIKQSEFRLDNALGQLKTFAFRSFPGEGHYQSFLNDFLRNFSFAADIAVAH